MPRKRSLTEEQIKTAKALYEQGYGFGEIAKLIGATYMQVRYLLDDEFREYVKRKTAEWIEKHKDVLAKRSKVRRALLNIKRFADEFLMGGSWERLKEVLISLAEDEEIKKEIMKV